MLSFRRFILVYCSAILLVSSNHKVDAAFPDDLDDVVFIEEWANRGLTDYVRGMTETAKLSIRIGRPDVWGVRELILDSDMRSVWPALPKFVALPEPQFINANAWLFVELDEVWNAGTFEFMRVGQTTKSTLALAGDKHLRFSPLQNFTPQVGEVYGFMVAGITRAGLQTENRNINERSNVALYQWGVGPISSLPNAKCVEPEPDLVNNAHTYLGSVEARATVFTPTNAEIPFQPDNEPIEITVADDRSLRMTVDGQVMNTQVSTNGAFTGRYTLNETFLRQQCRITIDVSGTVNGRNISGVGVGARQSCASYEAELSATFRAQSSTAPDYIDERPKPRKQCVPSLGHVYQLLLDDDPSQYHELFSMLAELFSGKANGV